MDIPSDRRSGDKRDFHSAVIQSARFMQSSLAHRDERWLYVRELCYCALHTFHLKQITCCMYVCSSPLFFVAANKEAIEDDCFRWLIEIALTALACSAYCITENCGRPRLSDPHQVSN